MMKSIMKKALIISLFSVAAIGFYSESMSDTLTIKVHYKTKSPYRTSVKTLEKCEGCRWSNEVSTTGPGREGEVTFNPIEIIQDKPLGGKVEVVLIPNPGKFYENFYFLLEPASGKEGTMHWTKWAEKRYGSNITASPAPTNRECNLLEHTCSQTVTFNVTYF